MGCEGGHWLVLFCYGISRKLTIADIYNDRKQNLVREKIVDATQRLKDKADE